MKLAKFAKEINGIKSIKHREFFILDYHEFSIAEGISSAFPIRSSKVLSVVKDSGGAIIAVLSI